MNEVPEVFPAYRLVAEFADGQRLTSDGLTWTRFPITNTPLKSWIR